MSTSTDMNDDCQLNASDNKRRCGEVTLAETASKKQRKTPSVIIDVDALADTASTTASESHDDEEEEPAGLAMERNLWNEESSEDLESWLASNRPSHFSDKDYAWIQIENSNSGSPAYCPLRTSESSFDSSAYQPALLEIETTIENGKKVSASMKAKCLQAIQTIAQEQKCTVGKWMLFFKPQDAHQHWEAIARATALGQLGCSAKINPTKDRTQDAVCCIYTPNFGDQKEVQRVLLRLQGMGFVVKTGYKPDVFTHLGIYSQNQWRLPPTLYSVQQVQNWNHCKQKDGPLQTKRTVIWNETAQVEIQAWLETNPPSQYSEADTQWIQVDNVVRKSPGYDVSSRDVASFDASAYRPSALNKIAETIQQGKRVSAAMKKDCLQSLQQVAKQQKLVLGKWMIWLEAAEADVKWKEIARATAQGKLGCHSKIKPTKSTASYEAIVCHIYTQDFEDKKEISRVLTTLEENLGFTVRSGYKPEFFSLLGIQSKNEWRLPSTLYSVKEVKGWELNASG